jgi:hypothetical protein
MIKLLQAVTSSRGGRGLLSSKAWGASRREEGGGLLSSKAWGAANSRAGDLHTQMMKLL